LKTILGIDIGSSKTVALIADIAEEATITGVGITKSKGIKKGIITNIDQAATSIKQAVNDAKRIAGVNVNKAIVSISTAYTQSTKSHGIVNIPTNEITISEINRAIQTALHNATIPHEYEIIQALPYNFKVDDISDIEDPEGMSGSRLEVSVHITMAQKSGIENTKKMLKIAGLEIDNIVLSSFASAIATLNEDEEQQGVALVDIGATTSDLIIFKDNSVRYTDFIGIGSYHITNDLAMALHTPVKEAELIKLNIDKYSDEDIIEIPLIGDESNTKSANISLIKEVMSARINETLIILNDLIEKSRLKPQLTGIVLTGGFANLANLREIAIPIFGNMSVRIAKPKEIDGLFDNLKAPEFSTVTGLAIYALGNHSSYEIDSNRKFRSKYSVDTTSTTQLQEEHNIFNSSVEQKEDKKSDKEKIVDLMERDNKHKTSIFEKFKIWLNGIF
jgi:cell division protein FtsA